MIIRLLNRCGFTLWLLAAASSSWAATTRIELPSGDVYEGEIRDGQRTGYGVYSWQNGQRYEGGFDAGRRSGLGIFTLRDGTTFRGEFLEDRLQGHAVRQATDGSRELQIWDAGKLASQWPLREMPDCRLLLNGQPWMFIGGDCINGLAHGVGLAARLDGAAVIPEGRFIVGRLVEGDIRSLVPVPRP